MQFKSKFFQKKRGKKSKILGFLIKNAKKKKNAKILKKKKIQKIPKNFKKFSKNFPKISVLVKMQLFACQNAAFWPFFFYI